jgi:hypothetical protein
MLTPQPEVAKVTPDIGEIVTSGESDSIEEVCGAVFRTNVVTEKGGS